MTSVIAVATGSVLVLIGLCGVLAHHVDSRRQLAIVAGALAPFLMVGAVPGTLVFAFNGLWIGAALGFGVTVAAAATQWPLFRGRLRTTPAGRSELVVMQANILVGGADPDTLVAAVDELDVDVLTVSELTRQSQVALIAAGLEARLPYSFTSPGAGGDGTGIWSRHPLADEQRHDGFTTELLSARVAPPTGPSVLVFAVHPVPPWPREPSAWAAELELLRQLLAKAPDDAGPVVVAGDFNATYDHKRFRSLLDHGYRSAAVTTGAGIIPTYSANKWYPPIIAIDHILTRGATARTITPVALPGSDHRGIQARIVLS